jgi:hypothetical protein
MKSATELLPMLMIIAYMALGRTFDFQIGPMRLITLTLFILTIPGFLILRINRQLSAINRALLGYLVLSFCAFWVFPQTLTDYMAAMPVPILYLTVLLMVAIPPLFGRDLFTYHYSRQTASAEFQRTDTFKKVNRHMTAFWMVLFMANIFVSLIPNIFLMMEHRRLFTFIIPFLLLLAVGIPVTKFYPEFQEKRAFKTQDLKIAG